MFAECDPSTVIRSESNLSEMLKIDPFRNFFRLKSWRNDKRVIMVNKKTVVLYRALCTEYMRWQSFVIVLRRRIPSAIVMETSRSGDNRMGYDLKISSA